MGYIPVILAVLSGATLMLATFYVFTCIAWLILPKRFFNDNQSFFPSLSGFQDNFIAHRIELGDSPLYIRDFFFRATLHHAGVSLKPWLPVPRPQRLFISWSDFERKKKHLGHHVIGIHTSLFPMTLWVTERQLRMMHQNGLANLMETHTNNLKQDEQADLDKRACSLPNP